MIDPNFWISEDVAKLSHDERLLFIGLFSIADDYGKGKGNPSYIRASIYPYEDIPLKKIEEWCVNISRVTNICFYRVDDKTYYKFMGWDRWQTVSHPTPSSIPEPPESFANDSRTVPESFSPNIINIKESNIKEDNSRFANDSRNIINYLNQKTSSNFKVNSVKTQALIKARFKEGFKVEDFYTVIDKKVSEWQNTEFQKFLIPETLFSTKFEGYLNQQIKDKQQGNYSRFRDFENKRESGYYEKLFDEGTYIPDRTGGDSSPEKPK